MSEKKNNGSKLIIGLLVAAVAILAYLLTQSKGEATDLATEKERLLFDLESSRAAYSEMESTNDSLDAFIVAEEARLTRVIDSVKNVNEADAAQIKKLQNRVWSLKQREKKLVAQIEELNAKYDALEKEKAMVDDSLATESAKNAELTAQNRMLEKEVAIGSMLQAPVVEAQAVKVYKSGKVKATERARRATRISTCASIAKNNLAAAGVRTVYLRITTPDNKVLNGADGEEASFDFNGQPLLYSSKVELDYQNEAVELCVEFDKGEWAKGVYQVELYTEGYELGRSKVNLR